MEEILAKIRISGVAKTSKIRKQSFPNPSSCRCRPGLLKLPVLTPKRYNEHPRPFLWSPPPRGPLSLCSGGFHLLCNVRGDTRRNIFLYSCLRTKRQNPYPISDQKCLKWLALGRHIDMAYWYASMGVTSTSYTSTRKLWKYIRTWESNSRFPFLRFAVSSFRRLLEPRGLCR